MECPETQSADTLMRELQTMVGLHRVKAEVAQLVDFLKVQQLRKSKGLPGTQISRHLVFMGNPGTGKTTVARLLASIYKALGILSKGHLVETERSGLVAGYLGQTAIKVQEIVSTALGGVLFIDEAYALVERADDSFGQEAIDTLLKLMEDHRDDLIVVVAGYTEKMTKFLSSNPGMKSRFNKYITFEDYSPDELVEIFEQFCSKAVFRLTPAAKEKLEALIRVLHEGRDETFGNGRLARNLFEAAINKQATRIVAEPRWMSRRSRRSSHQIFQTCRRSAMLEADASQTGPCASRRAQVQTYCRLIQTAVITSWAIFDFAEVLESFLVFDGTLAKRALPFHLDPAV